jgi:hypothetical protein
MIAMRAIVLIKIVFRESLVVGLGVTVVLELFELLGVIGKGVKLVQVDRLQSVKLS